MLKKKSINIHLISDFTGETTTSIVRGIETQFKDVKFKKFYWFYVKNISQINEAIFSIKKNNGIVIYTVLGKRVRDKLYSELSSNDNVIIIPAIEFIVKKCAKFIGQNFNETIERNEDLKKEYFEKISSIQYTIDHDDGKNLSTIQFADIVLIGLSRTSKTPTSIYLSYRGYKVANIPFFINDDFEKILNKDILKNKLLIWLDIDLKILSEIRSNRKQHMFKNNQADEVDMDYENINYIKKENELLSKFMSNVRHYKINTTNKSIEETCSKIITLYEKYKNSQNF